MNIELNQDELNLLIECITKSKNITLENLDCYCNETYTLTGDLKDQLNYLDSLYNLKFKLCNYSIALQEEN